MHNTIRTADDCSTINIVLRNDLTAGSNIVLSIPLEVIREIHIEKGLVDYT
jgi:hypothetical protein